MATIQIRNVPDDVHLAFRRRAAAAGQSLQEYLLGELIHAGRTPTMSEILERVGHRSGGRLGLSRAADDVRADRDNR